MPSFDVKAIEVSIVLAEGDFGGGNTLTLTGGTGGMTLNVTVDKPGQPDQNKAEVNVKGLTYEHMAQLTTLGFRSGEMQKNMITIRAGTEGVLSTVYEGEITEAWADFNPVPDPEMKIKAESGSYPQLTPEDPVSVDGDAPVASLMEAEAKAMGYAFVNQGVTASVRNAVFTGSPVEKLRRMAAQVGAELVIDDRTVYLLPGDGTAREGNAVSLKADTGLIGHPTFSADGIECVCLFNPDVQQAGLIEVESIVPKASGTWKVTKLTHNVSSTDQWTTEIKAEYVGGGDG
jgi:hypothetical protein